MMSTLRKYLIIFLSALVLFSCSDDLYFKQAEELSIEPIFDFSLINFKISPIVFFDENGVLVTNTRTETAEFKIFETALLKQNTTEFDFSINAKNEFSSDVSIKFELLDSANNTTKEFNFTITSGNLQFEDLQNTKIDASSNVVNTVNIRITITLLQPGNIQFTGATEFELKSALRFYLKT